MTLYFTAAVINPAERGLLCVFGPMLCIDHERTSHEWQETTMTEGENEIVLVSACERPLAFDPLLLCVTMVLACEIPHTPY